MAANDFSVSNMGGSGDVMKFFQIKATNAEKSSSEMGKQIAQNIANTLGGVTSYYLTRNTRFQTNRNWASGRIDVKTMFRDRLNVNGKKNYINMNWACVKLVNTIIGRLVGRWMGFGEKISVKATDPLSVKSKIEQYEQAEFVMRYREQIMELQQASGVPLISQDQFIPEDEDDLELWFNDYQLLPEEIGYGKGINQVFTANGWYDVLKEKLLRNSATYGLVGTYTWMDSEGVIHVDWINPFNIISSYSEFPDFRDTNMRGMVVSMKLSELRRKYGVEFGGKLTEQQLCMIASTSRDWGRNDKITWIDEWVFSYYRPYDDYNIDVLKFEIKTLDVDGYTVTTTKKNKSTIIRKGRPEKLDENQEYVEDKTWNIYEGAYIKDCDILLHWSLKDNMIRPQDPKELGNCEFSYSFYMYDMEDMRNVAIPEKVEEPIEQMILIRLKMQQIISSLVPPGAAIDVDALNGFDLGLSEPTSPQQVKRIYEQTGKLYYKGKDDEGNPLPLPIKELANSGFLSQMQGLIAQYQFNYEVLKNELGEDPNLMSQAVTPRVTAGNVSVAQEESNNATGYMYNAYKYVMADTAKKVACLLKPSVEYGAQAYRHIIKEDEVKNRIFSTQIEMLPTQMEVQRYDAMLNEAIAANPELLTVLDPFKLIRIAREDVKLAEVLFRRAQKKLLKQQRETAQQQSDYNAKVQVESMKAKAQADGELEELKGRWEEQKTKVSSEANNKSTVLAGFFGMYQKGIPIPPELKSLEEAVLQNVALPAIIQNQQQQEAILAKMQQDFINAQQQQQQEGQVNTDDMQQQEMEQEQPMDTQQQNVPI